MTHQKFRLVAVSLLIAAALGACDKPGPAEKAGKQLDQTASDAGKKMEVAAEKVDKNLSEQGTKAAQAIDDTEITTRVKAAIFAEPGLKTLQISVDTIKGVVTLSGSVDSTASYDRARSLAGAVTDVKDVVNQLVVTPAK